MSEPCAWCESLGVQWSEVVEAGMQISVDHSLGHQFDFDPQSTSSVPNRLRDQLEMAPYYVAVFRHLF
jgi:hypothetical protein